MEPERRDDFLEILGTALKVFLFLEGRSNSVASVTAEGLSRFFLGAVATGVAIWGAEMAGRPTGLVETEEAVAMVLTEVAVMVLTDGESTVTSIVLVFCWEAFQAVTISAADCVLPALIWISMKVRRPTKTFLCFCITFGCLEDNPLQPSNP